MPEYQLTQGIIDLSSSSNWDAARLEWRLSEIYEADEPETCLCGHYPIIEVCVISNKNNGNITSVGNCCVRKFMALPSDKIFQAIKRVRKDNEKSLNAEAIQYAYDRDWINDWEKDFYLDVMRKLKKSLSQKQLTKKIQINNKLARNMKRRL